MPRTTRAQLIEALRLCAPVVAAEVHVIEDCACLVNATDAAGMDRAAIPDYLRALKAHRALVTLGLLKAGVFKARPTRALKIK